MSSPVAVVVALVQVEVVALAVLEPGQACPLPLEQTTPLPLERVAQRLRQTRVEITEATLYSAPSLARAAVAAANLAQTHLVKMAALVVGALVTLRQQEQAALATRLL